MEPQGPFTCVTRRHYAEANETFATLQEAIEFATADTDDYYVGEIRDTAGQLLYDHTDPFAGWVATSPMPAIS